jgi:ABC-type polysaccharide/polyol phosphate transport system ATPase subunit
MMRLMQVSLSIRENGPAAGPILQHTSIALPTNRRMAVLGAEPAALTEVLAMLAGMRTPDAGWIERGRVRSSPVVNAGSAPGRTLVPALTAIENIRLAAEANGVDPSELIALVESACQFGKMLALPVNNFDRSMRRKLESTLVAAIPFDCYYIDRLHEFEAPIIWQFVQVAKQRGAGIVFTSNTPKQVRKFAELEAMIQDGSLEMRDCFSKAPASETG